jgi:hypothetical protein
MSKPRNIALGKRKSGTYKILPTKCREKFSQAEREDVKNKINSLSSSFRKELQRIVNSKKSGADSEDVIASRMLVLCSAMIGVTCLEKLIK